MGLIESLEKGKYVVVAELDAPKGADTSSLVETAELIKGRVDALLITDMPSAVMRMSSISAGGLLHMKGHEIICNITCRDRNVLALQSDLLGAAAMGLPNLLISDGDDISFGDHPKARSVKEVDADGFISIARKLKDGTDSAGNRLESAPKINIGAFVHPGVTGDALDRELARIQVLDKEGVSFLVTPPFFDPRALDKFLTRVRPKSKIPVLASIIMLKSVATARFLNLHVDGVSVPDKIIDRLYSAGDKFKESIMIAADLIKEYKNICGGVNLMAMGWEAKIPAILDAAGI